MPEKKPTKSAVFFSTGLGDGLQLLPLCRALKEEGHALTGVFTSACPTYKLIVPLGVLDDFFVLRSMADLIDFAFRKTQLYDHAFIEYSSSSLSYALLASLIAKKVATNRSKWYLRWLPNLTIRKPLGEAHLLLQNLHLALITRQLQELESLYHIDSRMLAMSQNQPSKSGQRYLVVQLCAANNSVSYKNWPMENWPLFLKAVPPYLHIFLIGDENETAYGEAILKEGLGNVHNLIGETSLLDLAYLIKHAALYIGLDSGSMHLAAMLGTPTFTIWGPTDPKTLGYEVINNQKHRDVSNELPCHPCKSWIRPNTSRFADPLRCPNQECIKSIGTVQVIEAFWAHWDRLYPQKEFIED